MCFYASQCRNVQYIFFLDVQSVKRDGYVVLFPLEDWLFVRPRSMPPWSCAGSRPYRLHGLLVAERRVHGNVTELNWTELIHWSLQFSYRVFTRSSKHRANVKQTSSKHQAGSSRPIGTPPPGSRVGLGLGSKPTADHVLYRPSNYNQPALLINMLTTIERRASCSMFARSCKHLITSLCMCLNAY